MDDDGGGNGNEISGIAAALTDGNEIVRSTIATLFPAAAPAPVAFNFAPDGPTLAFLQVAVTAGAVDTNSPQFTRLAAALMSAETKKAEAAGSAAANAAATAGLVVPVASQSAAASP